MTTEDFMTRLDARFPEIVKMRAQRDDIEDRLRQYPASALDRIFEAVVDEYTYKGPPKWAHLNKLAHEKGILKLGKSEPSYNRCERCGTAYSFEGVYCPTCSEIPAAVTVVIGNKPKGFKPVREDCGICRHYEGFAQGKMVLGPICESFGSSESNRLSECKDCVCRRCCFETFALKEASAGHPRLLRRLRDEDKFEDRFRRENDAGR